MSSFLIQGFKLYHFPQSFLSCVTGLTYVSSKGMLKS